jgi:uncharacterized protein (TIGR04222 family)
MCPSEQVDAAWHMHLTYTRSYWKRFCGDVLARPLHHDPTAGGPVEADKHLRMYEDTLAAYREAFGRVPPADVWPPAAVRFGDDLNHVAVNTRQNWVIPKAVVRRVGMAVAAVVLVGVGCGADDNPFGLKGMEFLNTFLWPLLISAIILGLMIRSWMKGSAGDDQPELDWADAAFMIGGGKRLLTATIARMVQTGSAVVEDGGKKLDRAGEKPTDLLEAGAWKHLPIESKDFAKLREVSKTVETLYAERELELKENGLLMTQQRRVATWLLTVLPLVLVVLTCGLPRLVMGLAGNKPSGFLIFTLIASVIAFGILGGITPRRTRRGDRALARLKTENGLLKHAKVSEGNYDAGMAVALFGTAALVGTELALLSSWYPRATGGTSGGGCGTGCGAGCGGGGGGGGCGGGGDGGGGGCGGCGGGGD